MTRIEEALAGLRRPAPDTLMERVLVGTSLADAYTTVEGPVGPLYVAWNERGVTACVPVAAVAAFPASHRRPAFPAAAPPAWLAGPLARTLETGRLADLPVDLEDVGEFRRLVLSACATIPPGEIRPYQWIAREIGRPAAVRAVGTALAKNPVPILIPCHRVVRADGRIGNYAFGSDMKRALLRREGVDPDDVERLARRGVRFLGSDTTGIYCYPTCKHARRITDEHQVAFRSTAQAAAAGYRPCRVCRPAS